MSAYVTKTEVEPFTMIPGFAANAYRASMATMDGNGVEIATDYAKKEELNAKQNTLPYNSQTGVYGISMSSAANVPWSGVGNKPAAVVLSGTYEDGTTFTFKL